MNRQRKRSNNYSNRNTPPPPPDLARLVPSADDIARILQREEAAERASKPQQLDGLSLEQITAELLRRQRSQESLAEYARSVEIPGAPTGEQDPDSPDWQYKPVETALAKHHKIFCDEIQAAIEKDDGRLMIFAPPGSAKSSYASVVAVAWAMAKFGANYRVIMASYAMDIARKQARRARALCRHESHTSIWDDQPVLAQDQRAAHEWALSNGAEYMAAGLLGGITGNRADLVIIDDPVAGREEADSETIQKKTMDAYVDDVKSRLKPRATVIIIQTRWNENDLSGQILPEDYKGQSGDVLCRDGQIWRVVNIPAEAEHPDDPLGRKPGEFLWTEWFGENHWLSRKNDPLPAARRSWASLYQQRPTAGDGIEFQRQWFKRFDLVNKPKYLTLYGASDYATKEDKGDFTEHGVIGIDENSDIWVIDWWFGQKTTDVTIANMVGLMGTHRPIKWWHEGGPIGEAITPAMRKAMREYHTPGQPALYTALEAIPSIHNKAVKLASLQARAAAGKVYIPNTKWGDRLIDQLCAFPAGRYDDAADTLGLLARGIDSMAVPYVSSPKPRPLLVPFTEKWLEWSERDTSNVPRYS